ncbi:ABC transporter substrate-binding protein [Kitasatospora sp. NPDC001603]|uniref:ABC transporter substrate-binding protein n=1 Tax=Kitasatospora sp. NPDC001603 TaxID=3154388 RepID=UPI00331E2E90
MSALRPQGPAETPAMSRRRLLGLAGAAAGVGLLTACGGSSGPSSQSNPGRAYTGAYTGPNVTLNFWNGFTGGDGPTMRELVKQFNAEHPNISVTMTTMQWADYYKKVPTAVQAGQGPNVGIAHQHQLATLAARRAILPLDDVAKELKIAESDFIPAIWQAGLYQGARYGIPLDVHCLASYWNTDLTGKAGLSDPSTNFDESLAKLAAGGAGQPFWMPNQWPAHLIFLSLLWQNGGQPFSDDTSRAAFDSDQGVQALTWMTEQVKKGYSPANVAQDTQYNAFKTGRTAVTWDGIWQINDLKTTAPSLQWQMGFLPTIGQTPAVWADGHNFVLMRQAPDDNKLAASKTFIDWIGRHSADWAKSGMIPARNSARVGADFQSSPQAQAATKLDAFRFLPAVPGIDDVAAQTYQVAVANAVLNQQTPKQALADAANTANQLLAANRQKFGS